MEQRMGQKPFCLFYHSWGYFKHSKGSEQLGTFNEMTRKLNAGYQEYAQLFERAGFPTAQVLAGAAFEALHDRHPLLWESIYFQDHYHPNAKGTFMNAAMFLSAMARHPLLVHRFGGRRIFIPLRWPDDVPRMCRISAEDDPNAPPPDPELGNMDDIRKGLRAPTPQELREVL